MSVDSAEQFISKLKEILECLSYDKYLYVSQDTATQLRLKDGQIFERCKVCVVDNYVLQYCEAIVMCKSHMGENIKLKLYEGE